MQGYGQFCPVARASEIFAERWTPLVLRELLAGSHRFNDLHRGVPRMSRSLLSKRLKELERAGLVEKRRVAGRRSKGYHLTPAGEALRPVVEGLGHWGQRWIAEEVREEDLDPALLMWDMRRNLDADELPGERVVVRFDFVGLTGAERRWWLLVDEGEAEICLKDPGFEVDLFVETSLRELTRFWVGRRSWSDLVESGDLSLQGPKWLVRSFPRWLGRSQFAGGASESDAEAAEADVPNRPW